MEACLENLKAAEVDWLPCFEHDKAIPDAQNLITEKALASKAEWLWYLEEDVIPPSDALRVMLPEARVISAKYRNRGGTWAYSLDRNGRLQYAGMGCLLVHRSVFSALKHPYFDVIWEWTWNDDETVTARNMAAGYGRQDVHFFAQLWKAGIEARLANIICGHASVIKYGEPKTNNGCHEIEII
jgi:hypothetical protein